MLKSIVPVQRGLFTIPDAPDDGPRLLGSRCRHCGEAFFPPRKLCRRCGGPEVEDILLEPRGKLYAYTVVAAPPPGYIGPAPYMLGEVTLTEGERILALIVDVDPSAVKVGMALELVLRKLREDEAGNDVVGYMFRPAGS